MIVLKQLELVADIHLLETFSSIEKPTNAFQGGKTATTVTSK